MNKTPCQGFGRSFIGLKQNAGGIGDGPLSVMVISACIPANLGHKQAIPFQGGAGFFGKTAGIGVSAGFADPASPCPQAQGMGIFLPEHFTEPVK